MVSLYSLDYYLSSKGKIANLFPWADNEIAQGNGPLYMIFQVLLGWTAKEQWKIYNLKEKTQ